MTYQALARKYRPQTFDEISGQNHITQALKYSLDYNKLHHAYLFTGTRGVGKTSIARLLAKSLNCLNGVSSNPCRTCTNCKSINKGNSIDLIEIDAASRTKVEDTREILSNVQYVPTNGRFKVYLIDEVHMLSHYSFNALLKVLEEPPKYVKFLLATTEHNKIPVTILSRCIQFNLRPLSLNQINLQLEKILEKESIVFEEKALKIIANSANGSMRDALSLTDQAIAFGNGNIRDSDVESILGLIDFKIIDKLLNYILKKDLNKVLLCIRKIIDSGKSSIHLLDTLADIFHRSIISNCDISYNEKDEIYTKEIIEKISQSLSSRSLQVCYRLVIKSKKDISIAPSEKVALSMIMLELCNSINLRVDVKKDKLKSIKNDFSEKNEEIIYNESISERWKDICKSANFKGITLKIMLNCDVFSEKENTYTLKPNDSISGLINDQIKKSIEINLKKTLQKEIKIEFQSNNKEFKNKEEILKAVEDIQNDKNIKNLEKIGFRTNEETLNSIKKLRIS